MFSIKLSGISRNKNSISFNFSKPLDCYSGYYITCSDQNKNTNATLDNTTFRGVCDNLTSGTKYTIRSIVHHLNEEIDETETAFTSKVWS